jgi:probable rRNA maturation factor
VVAAEDLDGPFRIEVHLLDDAGLRRVNREQRGVDAATDVLSFPLVSQLQPVGSDFALPPAEPSHLGEVLISFERARSQAAQYGHALQRELCYLLAHGVLHLLGYDHILEEERQRMRAREEAALKSLGLAR